MTGCISGLALTIGDMVMPIKQLRFHSLNDNMVVHVGLHQTCPVCRTQNFEAARLDTLQLLETMPLDNSMPGETKNDVLHMLPGESLSGMPTHDEASPVQFE
jgi:hypothetical protein